MKEIGHSRFLLEQLKPVYKKRSEGFESLQASEKERIEQLTELKEIRRIEAEEKSLECEQLKEELNKFKKKLNESDLESPDEKAESLRKILKAATESKPINTCSKCIDLM